MKIDLRCKGINPLETTKDYLNKRLSRLDKFTTRPLDAKVVFKQEKHKERNQVKVEVTILLGTLVLRAEEVNDEIKTAIDACAEKLEKQIKSNKHKLVRNLQEKQGINDLFIPEPEKKEPVNSAVKIKEFKLEIMTFDEAVTAMELGGWSFYVYKNEEEEPCVVYIRNDGEYGLIKTH